MDANDGRWYIPGPLFRRWKSINARVSSLELAVDTLLGDACYTAGDQVGFNGQMFRKQIFRDCLALGPEAIVECGTFLGNTTGFMAEESGLPIFTSEIDRRSFYLAKTRLRRFLQIHFHLSDSRAMLRDLAASDLKHKFLFFYLDAHWFKDLPLREELQIIATSWAKFVVMIDDFEVPGDPGYGFDDYGEGNRLAISLVQDVLDTCGLLAFAPAARSEQETGLKRGSITIAPKGPVGEKISQISSLRQVGRHV